MVIRKRDLTSLSKRGRVVKHRGKGATEQRTVPGDRETLTGGDPFARMTNRYPAAPQPIAPPTSAPPLGGPPLGGVPTAAMPPPGMGVGPPEEEPV